MDRRIKKDLLYISLCAAALICLAYSRGLSIVIHEFTEILIPILCGLLLAFVAHVPVNLIQKLLNMLFRKAKRKLNSGTLRFMSLVISLTVLMILVVLLANITVPHLISSVKSLYVLIIQKWPEWTEKIKRLPLLQAETLAQRLEETDIHSILDSASSSFNELLMLAAGVPSSLISWATTAVIALVISVYALLDSEHLCSEGRKFAYAYFPSEKAERMIYYARLTNHVFTKFLSGQFLEASILGVLMFAILTVSGVPYAGIIAIMTGVCSFIPYVGATFSWLIGGLLTFLAAPERFLVYCVVYCVTQFVENQFIYPHVVGTSVGIPPLLTLIAVVIGGRLMGFFGMIFCIPLAGVLYTIYQENTQKRLVLRGYRPADSRSGTINL